MPAVLVLLLAGTWLLSGALVTGTDPLIVAVGRTAVCCLVLTAVAGATAEGRADLRRAAARRGTVWLLGLLGFAGYAAGTLLAIPRIGTSLTNLVVALMPCASVAVGALFFGERSGTRKAAGAVLACAAAVGYAALGADAGDADGVGLLLVAAATVAFAGYGFLYRQRLSGLPPLAVLPVLLAAATCLLLPMALPALISHPRPPPRSAERSCSAPPCTHPPTSYSTGSSCCADRSSRPPCSWPFPSPCDWVTGRSAPHPPPPWRNCCFSPCAAGASPSSPSSRPPGSPPPSDRGSAAGRTGSALRLWSGRRRTDHQCARVGVRPGASRPSAT